MNGKNNSKQTSTKRKETTEKKVKIFRLNLNAFKNGYVPDDMTPAEKELVRKKISNGDYKDTLNNPLVKLIEIPTE